MNRLAYALPAWVEFLTADLLHKLNSLLKKCFKYGHSKLCNNSLNMPRIKCLPLSISLHNMLIASFLLSDTSIRSLRSWGHKVVIFKVVESDNSLISWIGLHGRQLSGRAHLFTQTIMSAQEDHGSNTNANRLYSDCNAVGVVVMRIRSIFGDLFFCIVLLVQRVSGR